MISIRTILKMAAPVVLLPALGLFYWELNMNQMMFVSRLGCGCAEGFNANSLTYCFCFGAMAAAGTASWFFSRDLGTKWRAAYLGSVGILLWEFLVQFIDRNLWA